MTYEYRDVILSTDEPFPIESLQALGQKGFALVLTHHFFVNSGGTVEGTWVDARETMKQYIFMRSIPDGETQS